MLGAALPDVKEAGMSTTRIRAQIAAAWEQEARTRAFARLVRKQLESVGAGAVPEDSATLADILHGWHAQLDNVPALIDAMRTAANDAGIAAAVEPILAAAEDYFHDEDDVLPDHHGVLGLLDDMYLALSLIHHVSERHRECTGEPLIEVDLSDSIAAVRPLFRGARLTALDERIDRALHSPALERCVATLATVPQCLHLHLPKAA
jgi:hypothetical protein